MRIVSIPEVHKAQRAQLLGIYYFYQSTRYGLSAMSPQGLLAYRYADTHSRLRNPLIGSRIMKAITWYIGEYGWRGLAMDPFSPVRGSLADRPTACRGRTRLAAESAGRGYRVSP